MTATPLANTSITKQFDSYASSQCGTWSYSYAEETSTVDVYSTTYCENYASLPGTSCMSGPLGDPVTTTRASITYIPTATSAVGFYPYGFGYDTDAFEAPLWDGNGSWFDASEWLTDPEEHYQENIEAAGLNGLDAFTNSQNNYITTRASALEDSEWDLPLPTGLVPWLAAKPSIKSRFPYIASCWPLIGIGQPTVHIPVNQLTVTSSHTLTMNGAFPAASTSAISNSPDTESSVSSLQTPKSTTTVQRSTQPQDTGTTSSSTQNAQPAATTGNNQPDVSPTHAETQLTTVNQQTSLSANTEQPTEQSTQRSGGNGGQSESAQATSTDVGGLAGAINSIAHQGQSSQATAETSGAQQAPSAQTGGAQQTQGAQTTVVAESATGAQPASSPMQGVTKPTPAPTSAGSVSGFAIGMQTASPGGPAITSSGTTYSALSSGSGLQVVANGQTSTVFAATTGGSAQPTSNGNGYAVNSQSLSAGGSAVTYQGTTYSALSSGSGVVVAANGASSTILHSAGQSAITPAASGSGYQVAGQTITAGGPAATVSGTTYSALASGSGVQVAANGVTSTAYAAVGSTSNVASIASGYGVAGQTLLPGSSAITITGTTYSALPSGSGVVVAANGASSTILGSPPSSITSLASPNEYNIGGQTITAGGSALTVSGTTYSALSSGSGVVEVQNGVTSTIALGSGGSGQMTMGGGAVISAVALSANAAASITVGSEVFRYQPLGANVAVIGSDTLTVGGPAVTENGETLSLVTGQSGLGLVLNGTMTTALPTAAAGEGVVTLGGQVFTAYADGSSRIVVDGQTINPGTVTVIDGETVSLSGTNLVIVSGTATSTEGLGGAIISGLNEPGAPAATSAPEAYTGAGRHLTLSRWLWCLAMGAAALFAVT